MAGRPPFESVDITPYEGPKTRRLRPPDELTDPAKAIFTQIVLTHTSGHFKPSDLSLLCRYAELAAVAAKAELEMTLPGGLVRPDGKRSEWFNIHASACKNMATLAPKLRIGPQQRAFKQSKKTAGAISYYDEMRMQKDWDQP